jgi:lysophospholipase L1-like esterase
VVLARLINRKTYSLETAEYNQQISDLAMQRIASGDLLYLVDMEPALIYPDDMSDNVHPNDVGYYKMAAVWKNELEAILPVCR